MSKLPKVMQTIAIMAPARYEAVDCGTLKTIEFEMKSPTTKNATMSPPTSSMNPIVEITPVPTPIHPDYPRSKLDLSRGECARETI